MSIFTELYNIGMRHFGTRPDRLRLSGCRIQVILSIRVNNKNRSEFLLVKSGISDTWGLPQEGVNSNEDFPDAVKRCLSVECGISLDSMSDVDFERIFNIRKISHIGILELPRERQDERLVTDHAAGTIHEKIKLKRKAYWVANITVSKKSNIKVIPDNNEVVDYKWMRLNEAELLIDSTNRKEKSDLFSRCLNNNV